MAKDPETVAAEQPLGNKATLDINAGVSPAGLEKNKKPGPPSVGEDAWLPS